MAINIEQVVQRYVQRTSSQAAKDKYRQSIDAVTESPMARAADKDDVFLARVEESVRSGKRRQALLAVPISRWKDNAKGIGADRLASGATKAIDKVRAHFQRFGPVYDQVKTEVRNMPSGTREAAKARVARAIDILMDAAGRS